MKKSLQKSLLEIRSNPNFILICKSLREVYRKFSEAYKHSLLRQPERLRYLYSRKTRCLFKFKFGKSSIARIIMYSLNFLSFRLTNNYGQNLFASRKFHPFL